MLKYVSVILSLILNAYPINFLWGFIVGENVSFHCNKIKHLLNTEGVQLKYLEAAHYQATAHGSAEWPEFVIAARRGNSATDDTYGHVGTRKYENQKYMMKDC